MLLSKQGSFIPTGVAARGAVDRLSVVASVWLLRGAIGLLRRWPSPRRHEEVPVATPALPTGASRRS